MYSLDLPSSNFVDHAHPHLLGCTTGKTFITISNGHPMWEPESIQPTSIAFPVSAAITVVDPPDHDRWHLETRESQTHGHKTILVLHIIALDYSASVKKRLPMMFSSIYVFHQRSILYVFKLQCFSTLPKY
jgi:hypothetical protein